MDDNWRLVRCGERDQPKITKTEIVLDCENVVIGRNVDLKYRLDCPNISRQHACMKFSNGYWDITDLRSHNGVFVNGVKIAPSSPVTVHESDIIGFGKPVAKSEDVFVFKLMKNVRPVIKKEPPDQSADEPKHKPPLENIIQLSDDDDVVVTAAFCKRKRNIPATSPQHSSIPGPSSLVNGSVVPALKVERDDCNESSSGLQAFSNEVSSGMVASMSLKAEAIPVSTFQPQRTPVIGGGAEALNRASCEAFETCKNGTGFPASSQAQRVSSLPTPMNVTVSSSSTVAVPSTRGATQAVEDSTLTRTFQNLPLRAVKREELVCNDQPAGEFRTCSPTDALRPIKQDPEGETRNGTWSVSNIPAVSHLENGSRNSPDSSGCASLASSKTGMHLKNSTSLHQHKKDCLDSVAEATFSEEVQLEESAHPQVHAGEALGAEAVELCAKPVVGESMPSDRTKNTTPKETPALMVVSQAKPQGAFSEASSSTVLGHAMELHVTREYEAGNHRSPVRPEQKICKQSSSTVVNEAEHILKKPISPSLFILFKPCSVVLKRLASPEKYISESHHDEEEDSSEEEDDVLLAAGSSDMSFSQEDQIITISSDSEDDAGPVADSNQVDLQIKREPKEIEEIVNDGTDFDDNVLLENQCPSDLPEERSDCVLPPMAEDRELEKRLVWNEPELEEEVTSADERQPENDFFPVLSQSFDDEPAPAKKAKSSTILVEPLGRPPSSTHAVSAHSGNRKSPKKKESLRASLIKSMKKHRVPITDFKSRDVPREPSAAEETEDRRQVGHKNRFKSRTALLLDTHDAKNIAKKKPCSTPTTVNAVHPVSKVGTCNRSSAAVESAKQSAVGEGACAVRACSPPQGTFPVQSEPCSRVPSFKKFVRISRVLKPSPVPVTAGVPPQQNGMPTSSSSVGPCGSPRVERMDVEPTTSWSMGPHGSTRVERMEVEPAPVKRDEGPAAWLPAIPPGSPPTSERMEVDSGAPEEEAAAVSPPRPSRGSPPVESMDVDGEKKRRVWFHITEPSNRTDQERAEFTERVRASLKKKKLESAGQRSKANLEAFIAFILGWKVPWLKEQQASATPPPLLDMNRFRSKRVMYSSLAEYKLVHFHFLCLEVWQSVFRSWQEYFSLTSRMTFSCAVENDVCSPGDVTILSCVVLVRQEDFEKSLYPVEGHLVRLDLRLKEHRRSAVPVFGFVMRHRFHRDTRFKRAVVPSLLQNSYVDTSVVVELKIQVRARSVMLDFSKTQRLSVVSKIAPTLRQMEVVSELEQSMFVQAIVRPNTRHFWCERGHPLRADIEGKFSEEQRQVISSAVAATRATGNDPRIVILHGPPGTGKTHTIIGMVTELLRSSSRQTMLIVAPSNTAVDEIARRLLAYRAQQAKRATPSDMMLKAVRIGQDNMVHADVRGICLTDLVNKNIQRDEAELSREADQAIAGLEKELRHWQDKKQQLASSTCPDARALRRAEFQLGDLQLRLQRAKESKRRHFRGGGGRQSRSVYERKLTILRGAHVVLSTLNSCRSRLLEEAFGRTSPYSFSCVLVDEATQCTEVEALLCLLYRTSRLILVGDPMQLPATVLSQEAVAHGFQESLFERFYKYLKQEADLKHIFALNEQRRMHSEICHFPSRNFYGGKLRPIAGLDEAYASFPLTPYLVFNIADSPETSEESGMSWLNRGEAAFVARLCCAIFDIVGVDLSFGIITPYQAQKSAIVEHLLKLLPRGQLTRDVNTVDSFQGQERDVIILSCVRAHNPKGQIGFVADARRLNVAITRAKKALYICGHLDSLKDNKEWAALVCDAKDRGKVQDISANCSTDLLTDIIRKPHSSVE